MAALGFVAFLLLWALAECRPVLEQQSTTLAVEAGLTAEAALVGSLMIMPHRLSSCRFSSSRRECLGFGSRQDGVPPSCAAELCALTTPQPAPSPPRCP